MEPNKKVWNAVKASWPKFSDELSKAPGKALSNYLDQITNPDPSLGDAASLMSQNMIPGGAIGAGAIALTDTAKAGGLGTVGGAMAKGFEAAKDAGRTWMGIERAPKFEINDFGAVLKGLPKALTDAKLSEVLDHPELYAQYPWLKDLTVRKQLPTMGNQMEGRVGGFNPSDMSISVAPGADAKSTILHEVQHAIQHKENFAGGGRASEPNYNQLAGEVESRNVQKRMGMTDAERQKTPFTRTYDVPLSEQLIQAGAL